MNRATAWPSAIPLQAPREAWHSHIGAVGLPLALFMLASFAAAPQEPGDVAVLIPLLAIAAGSIGISALVRRCWAPSLATRSSRSGRSAPAHAVGLLRDSMERGPDPDHIFGLVAQGAVEITGGAGCLLTLPSGVGFLADRWAVRRIDPAARPQFLAQSEKTDPAGTILKVDLTSLGETIGSMETWPEPGARLGREDERLLQIFASDAAVAVHHATLLSSATQCATVLQSKISEAEWWQGQLEMYADDVTQTHKKLHQVKSTLEEAHMVTLETLAGTVDARDPITYGHCRRVAELTSQLAGELGLSEDDCQTIERAALLHDIGKLGVPDSTLRKTTPLTQEDSIAIRHHPELGYRMLSSLRFLGEGLTAIRYHHERFDGSGYPYGLVEDQIPIMARIIAVADAYDAITSDRPYRSGRSQAQGMAEIARCSGTHFDPEVVGALLRVLRGSSTPLLVLVGDGPHRGAATLETMAAAQPSASTPHPFLTVVNGGQ